MSRYGDRAEGASAELTGPSINSSRATTLAARLVDPNRQHSRRGRGSDTEEDDEDAIFAELEEEIENDSNYSVREQAMSILKNE